MPGKRIIRFGADRIGEQYSSSEEDLGDYHSPTYIASRAKNRLWDDVRYYMDSYPDVSATLSDGTNALYWAARYAKWDIVELLIEGGANVNVQFNKAGVSALHWIVRNGDVDLIQLLDSKGHDINEVCTLDNTDALYWATKNGNWDVVKFLVTKDDKVDIVNSVDGTSALYWSAAWGNLDVVNMLLAQDVGKDVINSVNVNDGSTAIGCAIKMNNMSIAELLLANGADISTIPVEDYKSFLDWSFKGNRVNTARLLLKDKAKYDDAEIKNDDLMNLAIDQDNVDLMLLLLENGSTLNGDFSEGGCGTVIADILEERGRLKRVVNGLRPKGFCCGAKYSVEGYVESIDERIRGAVLNFKDEGNVDIFTYAGNVGKSDVFDFLRQDGQRPVVVDGNSGNIRLRRRFNNSEDNSALNTIPATNPINIVSQAANHSAGLIAVR